MLDRSHAEKRRIAKNKVVKEDGGLDRQHCPHGHRPCLRSKLLAPPPEKYQVACFDQRSESVAPRAPFFLTLPPPPAVWTTCSAKSTTRWPELISSSKRSARGKASQARWALAMSVRGDRRPILSSVFESGSDRRSTKSAPGHLRRYETSLLGAHLADCQVVRAKTGSDWPLKNLVGAG
jgi:hypothetical protein